MAKKIIIDGVIGTGKDEISSSQFRAMLPTTGEPIELVIHSEGGSVFEGFRIYDLLKEYPGHKKAVIQSSAFSIASFIPMACDEIEIAPNGYMMVHNPYTVTEGDDEELAKTASLMGQLKENMVQAYAARTGRNADEITALLKQETYLDASQCVAMGFCDRITTTPVVGRVFSKVTDMPHGVVAALFGAGAGGNKNSQSTEKRPMSESTRVAASLKQIKAAFPKAKSDFIVRCMEKEMTMEEIGSTVMEEVMDENETLSAKVKALEDENAALKAAATAKAEEYKESEQMMSAKASSGVAPVARATTGAMSAKAKWNSEIASYVATGMSKAQAAVAVNRANPNLRQQMLAEVNS